MGIAMEIARVAVTEATKENACKVSRLNLRVGRWSGVEIESLRFSLETVSEGTMLEGCQFDIVPVEPHFKCKNCGNTFGAESYFDPCPACAETGAEMVAGDEMTLVDLEVDEQ